MSRVRARRDTQPAGKCTALQLSCCSETSPCLVYHFGGLPPRSGVWDTERHCGTELGVPTVAGEWEIGTEGAGKGFCESLCSSLLDNGLGKERDTWGHSRFHDYIQWIVNIKSRERL